MLLDDLDLYVKMKEQSKTLNEAFATIVDRMLAELKDGTYIYGQYVITIGPPRGNSQKRWMEWRKATVLMKSV